VIRILHRYFPKVFRDAIKHEPLIQGVLRVELRSGGKLKAVREGYNIWTLTGREYLAEIMALSALNPSRATFREDRVAFIGVGTGAQPEISNITSLVEPVPYKAGEFLAFLGAPAQFPITGVDSARTAVQFIREFGQGEISLGFDVVLSEAGLYTDGDPDNDNDINSTPTDFTSSAGRAPVAYKAYEPVTKTIESTLRYVWEVRIL
jgi:hypothetical protein